MFYRRITDVDDQKPSKRKRSDPHNSPAKRMKQGYEDTYTNADDHDEINEFRRVQIIHRGFGSSTEQLVSPEDTTGRCIEEVDDTFQHNGERDITGKHHPSRRGLAAEDARRLHMAPEAQRAERERFREQHQRNRIFAASRADGPPRHSRRRMTEHMPYGSHFAPPKPSLPPGPAANWARLSEVHPPVQPPNPYEQR